MTAKVIAGIVAVIASYILNREWSFRDRGGRERHHEALLFFAFSGVGVLLSMAPLWVSSYVLDLRVPMVSLTLENIADSSRPTSSATCCRWRSVSGPSALGVPQRIARAADKALESTFTAGGIAEVFEDVEASGTVTLLGAWRRAGAGRISSATPRTRGCRKPRDTAARGPVRRAECRRTPTDLVTRTQRSTFRSAVSDRSVGAGIRRC